MLKLSSPGDNDDAEGEAEPMKYARHCRAARAAAYYDARQMRMFISGDRSSWPRSDKIARWAARDGTRWADTVLTRVLARSDAQLAAGDKASRTLRPVDDTAVDTGQSPLAAVIIQLSVSSTPLVSLTPKPRAAVSSSIAD